MRDGAHEIEDPSRRPAPVYPPVLRPSAPEVAAARDIHFSPRRSAGDDLRMQLRDQLDAQRHQLAIQRQRVVAVVDRDRALPNDISRVRARNHVMQRDARLALSIHQHPIHRRTTAIRRQERRVQLKAPREPARARLGNQMTIGERINDRGLSAADFRHASRNPHRNKPGRRARGQFRTRPPPDFFMRVVAMRQ